MVSKTSAAEAGVDYRERWRIYLPPIAAYILLTFFTNAYFMGDTLRYTDSIVARLQGDYFYFWEFGHLFWRPLVWLLYLATHPLVLRIVGPDIRFQVTLVLVSLTWIFGLACVIAVVALLRLYCRKYWAVWLAAIGFISTNAFLNYMHTGCPYIPGLTAVLTGFYLLISKQGSTRSSILAGIILAIGVCFWFPYILALPAIFLAPILLSHSRSPSSLIRQISYALIASALVGFFSYLSIGAFGLGLRNFAGFHSWFNDASHGLSNLGGLPRAVFGVARSLINMGDDGRVFKRYVVKDPFNPVSISDLVKLSLWKLGLFYLFILALVISLIRFPIGRRFLILNVVVGLPLSVFAIFLFDAGQIERYLPLYPTLFLALGYAIESPRVNLGLKLFLVLYLGVATITNIKAMSLPALSNKQKNAVLRREALKPVLRPESRIFTSHTQDELILWKTYVLFITDEQANQLNCAVDPNTSQVDHWRESFASEAQSAWASGGDVWLSNRLLAETPKAEWNWVEGDDPRVSWKDLHQFFSQFETGQAIGGEDGFRLLLPSPENRRALTLLK
jgi:hypothetical protein